MAGYKRDFSSQCHPEAMVPLSQISTASVQVTGNNQGLLKSLLQNETPDLLQVIKIISQLNLVSVACQILCTPTILLFLPFDNHMFGETNQTCKIWHTSFAFHFQWAHQVFGKINLLNCLTV